MIVGKGIFDTLHISPDEEHLPWIETSPGIEIRLLHARPDENLIATQFRAHPHAETGLHRHDGPVFGVTLSGAWGHDRRYIYHRGTYIYETPGVVHRFLNGPDISEVYFISQCNIEFLDGKKIIARVTAADMLREYLEGCERAGVPRPNILS